MVTIWPIFMSDLMTSAALTDILCARSPTEMVSGICTSRTTGSVGAWNVESSSWLRSPRRPPRCFGPPRQPDAPPVSPRVLMARFFAASSPCHATAPRTAWVLAGFLADFFSASPGLATGLCSVPSLGFSAASFALATCASRFATSARSRSCRAARSNAWRSRKAAWRRDSSSRILR